MLNDGQAARIWRELLIHRSFNNIDANRVYHEWTESDEFRFPSFSVFVEARLEASDPYVKQLVDEIS